ncbi:MAG: OmpA family protein [Pseudomonadota bacterium]|nr:OmpA family protein [Pseudomonadota bacterium]
MRNVVLLVAFVCAVALAVLATSKPAPAQQAGGVGQYTREEVQAAVMSFADSWAAQLAEAAEKTAARAGTPEVRKHTDRIIFYGAAAGFDIASSPNPGVNLLDMMVLVSLYNIVWNEYWGPEVYGDAAQPMIDMLRVMEEDIWGFAAKVMTPEQLSEIRGVIRQWRARNPDKQGVTFIRFSDFGALGRKPSLEKAMQPGGLLAPVREAAVAAEEIRVMGDRALYLMVRMQDLMPRRFEMAVKEILRSPELGQTLDDISGFRESSERYAAVLETLPGEFSTRTQSIIDQTLEQVSAERQAAINQLMLGLAQERQLALEQIVEGVTLVRAESIDHILEGLGEERKALMNDVGKLVERSETEAEAMLTHTFVLAAVLLLLYFLLRMVYRYATDRPAETWTGRVAFAGLLVIAALPIIAAALVYVHYASPGALYGAKPFAVTDVEHERPESVKDRPSGRGTEMRPVAGRTIRGSEADLSEMAPGSVVAPGATREDDTQVTEAVVVESLSEQTPESGAETVAGPDLELEGDETFALSQEVMVLQALFPRSGVEITPEFERNLAKMSGFLIDNPELRVDIQGHTDSRGSGIANQQLADERAKVVAQFLIQRGVAPGRIRAMGYGSSRPIVSNETVEGRAKNRRVEIRVIR